MLQRSSFQLRQLVVRKASSQLAPSTSIVLANGFRSSAKQHQQHKHERHQSQPLGSSWLTTPQAIALAGLAAASLTAATFCSAGSSAEAGLSKPREREHAKGKKPACGNPSCPCGDKCTCDPCLCGGKHVNKDGKVVTAGCKCGDKCKCNPCRCGEPTGTGKRTAACKCGDKCTCNPCRCGEPGAKKTDGSGCCGGGDGKRTAACKCGDKCTCNPCRCGEPGGKTGKMPACGNASCSCGDKCTCNPCLCGGKHVNKDGKVVTAGCKCGDKCTCNPCRCGEKTAACKCGDKCKCNPCRCGSRATPYDAAEQFLFPKIEPYKTGHLQVSKVHSLYYEECGNPKGKPVIMVHGGPGAGCNEAMRRYHDPKVYRIILLDQRGSGRSTPHASLEDNTTWHLIEDMEKLRRHLKIDKWQVFGGSWGSTLSIAYAINHPSHVTELILRGIFHVRKEEIDFYYQHGTNFIYPDRWEAYRDAIPEEERGDFVKAYHKRLTSDDPKVRIPAALAWTTWERTTSNLIPPTDAEEKSMSETKFAEAFARIENHYFYNKGFFPTDQYLIENAFKIRHIPTVIVQGRYDVVCPIKTAWDFHKAFPEADLRIVQTAGHSAMEPGIAQELVDATNRFKDMSSL